MLHEIMSSEDSLKSLSLDYLNLLINGQAFSDVAFSVEGRLVHAHRCVLAARSLFFRKLFCGLDPNHQPPPPPLNWPNSGGGGGGGGGSRGGGGGGAPAAPELVIPVSSIRYEVLVLVLQFLYSGQASVDEKCNALDSRREDILIDVPICERAGAYTRKVDI